MKDHKFTHLEQNLFLHPQKVIYWQDQKILLCADLHFGKAAHFRKSGVPVPEKIHEPDLERISELITFYAPERFIFLGDLFHSSYNNSWQILKSFCQDYQNISWELILGNHDILEPSEYNFLKIYEKQICLGPYILSHEPLNIAELAGKYNLCGHIHPSIRISGLAKQSLRVQCFYFGENHGILPAFGNFTGSARMPKRKKIDKIFAVASQKVIEIN